MESNILWKYNEAAEKMAKNGKCHVQASLDISELSSSGFPIG